MSIRNRLFLILTLMTLVPLLVLLFGVVEKEEQEIQLRTEHELGNTLSKMSNELQALLDAQKSLALGLSKVPVVQNFARHAHSASAHQYQLLSQRLANFFLEYQAAVPSIQGLRFIEAGGKTLVKAKEGKLIPANFYDPDLKRAYVANQVGKDFFQSAVSTQEDVEISNFELGQVTTDADFCPAMLRYSVPIRHKGKLLGVFVVNMWGTRVDTVVEATMGGRSRKAYIAELSDNQNRDGIYLYHRDNERRFANQLGSSFRFAADIGVKQWQSLKVAGSHGKINLDNGRQFYFQKMRPYENRLTEWLLIIETNRDNILASTEEIRKSILYLLVVLLLSSIITVRWLSSRIARPVQQLATIITDYADGENSIRYEGKRQDEIGCAGRAFNYLAHNLERAEEERDKAANAALQSERLAALGHLAAGIGHEINNPLQNILSLSTLIDNYLMDEKNDEIKEDIRLLKQEGKRCARIVQGVLNFARENDLVSEKFDLAKLLDDTLILMKHSIEVNGIKLNLHLSDRLELEGDPNQIQQVLVNVIINAVHASSPNSVLSIYGQNIDNIIRLEIIDQGCGIPESDITKVFNPFYTSKKEGEGTGLGLSVSYGIINKHSGRIQLENIPDGGVKATIELPVSLSIKSVPSVQNTTVEFKHVG
ncbi:MAG: sensor histidine kinase [Gammaproteobacteria bacterium]|nr:sensor histidine kinase [Gammaproteobacteria bacterium]